MEITPKIEPGQQIKGLKNDHNESSYDIEAKNEQLVSYNINPPEIKCEPILYIPIKDEHEHELEHPEVKTEPLESLHHEDYDKHPNDKMCIKNEIKSEHPDVSDKKECEQLKSEICKGCNQEFYYLLNHLQQEEQCKLVYSHEEVSGLQTETSQLISTKQKREYKKLCKFCHTKCKNVLEHLEQSSVCFGFYTDQEISSLQLNAKEKKSDGPKTDFSKPCKVCNTSFNRLLNHLRFNKTCKSQYTEEEMKKMKLENKRESNRNNRLKKSDTEDGKAKYLERERFRQMERRMRKMQENPEMEREKERLKQLEYRRKKKQEDPKGFREKANERKRMHRKNNFSIERREKERLRSMEYRKRKREEDPEGFRLIREKDNERKRRKYRKSKIEEDHEGFREKENERKRKNIAKNEKEKLMEKDLDWFSDNKKGQFKNEESEHWQMEVDYNEVEFMAHEIESSDGCSERDEVNSSNEEDSIEEGNKVVYSEGYNAKLVNEENEDSSIKEKEI